MGRSQRGAVCFAAPVPEFEALLLGWASAAEVVAVVGVVGPDVGLVGLLVRQALFVQAVGLPLSDLPLSGLPLSGLGLAVLGLSGLVVGLVVGLAIVAVAVAAASVVA